MSIPEITWNWKLERNETARQEIERLGRTPLACLLYTSDAADE